MVTGLDAGSQEEASSSTDIAPGSGSHSAGGSGSASGSGSGSSSDAVAGLDNGSAGTVTHPAGSNTPSLGVVVLVACAALVTLGAAIAAVVYIRRQQTGSRVEALHSMRRAAEAAKASGPVVAFDGGVNLFHKASSGAQGLPVDAVTVTVDGEDADAGVTTVNLNSATVAVADVAVAVVSPGAKASRVGRAPRSLTSGITVQPAEAEAEVAVVEASANSASQGVEAPPAGPERRSRTRTTSQSKSRRASSSTRSKGSRRGLEGSAAPAPPADSQL